MAAPPPNITTDTTVSWDATEEDTKVCLTYAQSYQGTFTGYYLVIAGKVTVDSFTKDRIAAYFSKENISAETLMGRIENDSSWQWPKHMPKKTNDFWGTEFSIDGKFDGGNVHRRAAVIILNPGQHGKQLADARKKKEQDRIQQQINDASRATRETAEKKTEEKLAIQKQQLEAQQNGKQAEFDRLQALSDAKTKEESDARIEAEKQAAEAAEKAQQMEEDAKKAREEEERKFKQKIKDTYQYDISPHWQNLQQSKHYDPKRFNVGIIGSQDAGKSTLMNTIMGHTTMMEADTEAYRASLLEGFLQQGPWNWWKETKIPEGYKTGTDTTTTFPMVWQGKSSRDVDILCPGLSFHDLPGYEAKEGNIDEYARRANLRFWDLIIIACDIALQKDNVEMIIHAAKSEPMPQIVFVKTKMDRHIVNQWRLQEFSNQFFWVPNLDEQKEKARQAVLEGFDHANEQIKKAEAWRSLVGVDEQCLLATELFPMTSFFFTGHANAVAPGAQDRGCMNPKCQEISQAFINNEMKRLRQYLVSRVTQKQIAAKYAEKAAKYVEAFAKTGETPLDHISNSTTNQAIEATKLQDVPIKIETATLKGMELSEVNGTLTVDADHNSGLCKGDRIACANGLPIASEEHLGQLYKKAKAEGASLQLIVMRKSKSGYPTEARKRVFT